MKLGSDRRWQMADAKMPGSCSMKLKSQSQSQFESQSPSNIPYPISNIQYPISNISYSISHIPYPYSATVGFINIPCQDAKLIITLTLFFGMRLLGVANLNRALPAPTVSSLPVDRPSAAAVVHAKRFIGFAADSTFFQNPSPGKTTTQ